MTICRLSFAGLTLIWTLLASPSVAQQLANRPAPWRDRTRGGPSMLRAFASVETAVKDSVVRFDLDGKEAAFGAIIDTNGLAISKASELSPGQLTCKLANGQRVDATLLSVDEESDVALLRVKAPGLKPIQWASSSAVLGQWALTPGIGSTPESVGIVSVPARKILAKQAYIGVRLDWKAATAKIEAIIPGLGAAKAGLQAGDSILTVNNLAVTDSDNLVSTLRNFREGQTVLLRVRREDQEWVASVEMMSPKPERRWRGLDRQERMNRLGGELSRRAEGFQQAIQHDGVLQPWQCGGPLLNLEGKAIGLNIARAGRVASYALPAGLVRQLIDELKDRAEFTVGHEVPADAPH